MIPRPRRKIDESILTIRQVLENLDAVEAIVVAYLTGNEIALSALVDVVEDPEQWDWIDVMDGVPPYMITYIQRMANNKPLKLLALLYKNLRCYLRKLEPIARSTICSCGFQGTWEEVMMHIQEDHYDAVEKATFYVVWRYITEGSCIEREKLRGLR